MAAIIKNINPNQGTTAGQTTIILSGTGFGPVAPAPAPTVNFGAAGPAGTVTAYSPTSITVTTPAHGAGTVSVQVTPSDGTGFQANPPFDQYTYYDTPVVSTVSPASGSTGTAVTIEGNNFVGVSAVYFGAISAPGFTVQDTQNIKVSAPRQAGSGAVDVRVANGGGTSAINRPGDLFTYS
jgi:hypothetical protein